MAAKHPPVSFTDVEIRSYLPSGWSISGAGGWIADRSTWQIDVHDGADNIWTIGVGSVAAAENGRLGALKAAIERLQRKALGRKSILTG